MQSNLKTRIFKAGQEYCVVNNYDTLESFHCFLHIGVEVLFRVLSCSLVTVFDWICQRPVTQNIIKVDSNCF